MSAVCDDHDHNAKSVTEALSTILDTVEPVADWEIVALDQALGRVLHGDLPSPIDVPAWPNSAMDGYALRAEDGTGPLRLVGAAFAGHPFGGRVGAGECVRIMTGAMVPEGANAVAVQERARPEGGQVTLEYPVTHGENIRQPGEDLRAGAAALPAGSLLRPAHLGVLASLGVAEIPVHRRLRVAFFSTGDELRPLGSPLGPGQIYDSNRHTLAAMLSRLGCDTIDLGRVPDIPDALRESLERGARMADVVISTGGVSVGEADYIAGLLGAMGQVHFWKINMKPGRPLAFGRIGSATFFGLPGNPVSTMVTFYQFVRPALLKRMGVRGDLAIPILKARCMTPLKKRPGRQDYQRGVLYQENGEWLVRSAGGQGSHILTGMAGANCLIVLPSENAGVKAGDPVDVQILEGLL